MCITPFPPPNVTTPAHAPFFPDSLLIRHPHDLGLSDADGSRCLISRVDHMSGNSEPSGALGPPSLNRFRFSSFVPPLFFFPLAGPPPEDGLADSFCPGRAGADCCTQLEIDGYNEGDWSQGAAEGAGMSVVCFFAAPAETLTSVSSV